MSSRRSGPAQPSFWDRALLQLSVGLLLAVGAGVGCVRTTSIGRASAPTDAHADRDTGAAADGDATLASDAHADTALDRGPIIGGGQDAPTDGPDGPDDQDAAIDAAAP
jgi:hypothetical protein